MKITAIDCHPKIREKEFKRLLGVPAAYEYEGPMAELRAWVEDWYKQHGHPWFYARSVNKAECKARSVVLDGCEIKSTELRKRFHRAQAGAAVVLVVGAGPEAEAEAQRFWKNGRPDRYYFLEVYASAVVEALLTEAGSRICAWAESQQLAVLPHYSPGYQGWNLQDQAAIFKLLSDSEKSLPGKIEVLESGMLRPKKSQLAVFGLTEELDRVERFEDLVPCKYCSYLRCEYRREPYRSAGTVESAVELESLA